MPEHAQLWTVAPLGDLTVLHATYVNHTFTRHAHEEFALAVTERGVLPLSVVDNSGILRSTSDDGQMQVLVTGSIDRERVCVSHSPWRVFAH
jgi:hypothetical protein